MKKFLIVLSIWAAVLVVGFGIALGFFHKFLKNYQDVYDKTRPDIEMSENLSMFSAEKVDELVASITNVECDTQESMLQFRNGVKAVFEGKTVGYDILKGEHTEDRPAYVITCDNEPVAILRLKKQEVTEKYGLPLWEIKSLDWLEKKNTGYTVLAPEGVTLTINGVVVGEDTAIETDIEHDRAGYFRGCAEIPTYNKYSIDHIYGEPMIEATNPYGDSLEVIFDEETKSYTVEFGTSEELKAEIGDYVVQFVIDYAQYITNDTGYYYLDHYFPSGSALLQGIKNNPRQYYADHRTPEIKNQELKGFTVYDDDTVCAHVYLEQHMLIYYSEQIKVVVTDINVFFFKDGDTWKVSGIAFENMEE